MNINEFSKLTGFYPSVELYDAIEKEYNRSDGDKFDFCKRYVEDMDFQVRLATIADEAARAAIRQQIIANHEALERKEGLEKEIERLKAHLEREQEWRPYQLTEYVSDEEYENLKKDCKDIPVNDDEAKETLHRYFGFDPAMIRIYHWALTYEKNRHGACRPVGRVERNPYHLSSDYNYYLFDCGAYTYEVHNGELYKYGWDGEV